VAASQSLAHSFIQHCHQSVKLVIQSFSQLVQCPSAFANNVPMHIYKKVKNTKKKIQKKIRKKIEIEKKTYKCRRLQAVPTTPTEATMAGRPFRDFPLLLLLSFSSGGSCINFQRIFLSSNPFFLFA